MIAIVDYGVGNIRSVERALIHVGAEARLTSDKDELDRAEGIVLPGVGAFAPALEKLSENGLGRHIWSSPTTASLCLAFVLVTSCCSKSRWSTAGMRDSGCCRAPSSR